METNTDKRIKAMKDSIQARISAGVRDEEGNLPDNLDELDFFLEDLVNKVIDPYKIDCPILSPGERKTVNMRWACENFGIYADVHLGTLEAEQMCVSNEGVFYEETYSLSKGNKEWNRFAEDINKWTSK